MLSSRDFAPYIGFTEAEVKTLTEKYNQDYEKKIMGGTNHGTFLFYPTRADRGGMLRTKFAGLQTVRLQNMDASRQRRRDRRFLQRGLRQMKSSALRLAGQRILPG